METGSGTLYQGPEIKKIRNKVKRTISNKPLLGLVLLGIIIVFITGCDRAARYKVLTFFFTGVPPLDQEIKDESGEVRTIKKAEVKKKRYIPTVSYAHGPYAAGQCELCHDASATVGFRKSGKEEPKGVPQLAQTTPGRLVTPLKELCIECHIDKSKEAEYRKGLWFHGPVANGNCTFCHGPHQSRFQYILLKETTIELCTQCHTSENIIGTEEHKGEKECTSCHNAHMGINRFLLKKDFNEIF